MYHVGFVHLDGICFKQGLTGDAGAVTEAAQSSRFALE